MIILLRAVEQIILKKKCPVIPGCKKLDIKIDINSMAEFYTLIV